jgi:DNA-binding MarR family transcriptional regulator
VRRLEANGYVTRRSHPADARRVMSKLTPKGVRLLQSIAPRIQSKLSGVLAGSGRRHLPSAKWAADWAAAGFVDREIRLSKNPEVVECIGANLVESSRSKL